MSPQALLLCSDLDRTLLPNGTDEESPAARDWFQRLAALPEVMLVYATGRDQLLTRKAIHDYELPMPQFVLGDVGSTIYACAPKRWQLWPDWEQHIAPDWAGYTQAQLAALLENIPALRLQEPSKQNTHKLSYYVNLDVNHVQLQTTIHQRLRLQGIKANLIWSEDNLTGEGLLDILPARANKYRALQFLLTQLNFALDQAVFAGDSGNDLPIFASAIPSIVVGNASASIKVEAMQLAALNQTEAALYIAEGGFKGMNGHYAAGILEGVMHYHPSLLAKLEDA